MKPLPKKINKTKMVQLYADQFSERRVLDEINSFIEELQLPKTDRIIPNLVKERLFKLWGLPTGYEMTDETKFNLT